MRISLAFWQNQWTKYSGRKIASFFLLFFLFNPYLLAREIPGIIETLETLVELERSREEQLLNDVASKQLNIGGMQEVLEVKIDPLFLRSIIFHSPGQYLRLAKDDTCLFYAALDNQLLYSSGGNIQHLPILYRESKDDEIKQALVSRQDFSQKVGRNDCFRNRELREIFHPQNIAATLKSIEFPIPKNQQECQTIHQSWKSNPYLPYLCRIPEMGKQRQLAQTRLRDLPDNQIRERRYYSQVSAAADLLLNHTNSFQLSYLENLCENLFDPQNFCRDYLAQDIWSRVLNNEAALSKMRFQCARASDMRPDQMPTREQFQSCRNEFKRAPRTCERLHFNSFPSFFPKPPCDIQSDTLLVSRLNKNYLDCPGRLDNEGITNVHRIVNHFRPREISIRPESCSSEAALSFASLYIGAEREEFWPLEICFDNPVTGDENCRKYIPGDHPTSPLAETRVVSSILRIIRSTVEDLNCRMISESEYRPNRLEFQNGCFIVFPESHCTFMSCHKKITHNQNHVRDLRYRGEVRYEYFPLSFTQNRTSLSYILTETLRLSETPIRNVSELRNFFENQEKGIIHGIGCLEDLLPQVYPKLGLNACRPLPFIIDGIKEEGADTLVSFISSIEDISTPRLMSWNYVINSLMNYSRLHPLRTWTLYGLH